MNAIIDAALSHARMVILSLVLLLVAGFLAYQAMPKESDPDVNIPIVYALLTLEGISPEDSERLLLRPVEQELRAIEGVKEMRSMAYQGGGSVLLEFDAGFDIDQALQDVRDKVDQAKADLPEDADEPTVHEVNLSLFPVLVVSLSGDLPQRTLISLADRLQDKLEGIDSVLEARLAGDREEQVEMIIDPLLLESYGLDANDIATLIGRSNRLVAAGNIDTGQGRFAIKVPGLFETASDILDMPLKVNGDAVVRVRDVATLRRAYKDAETYARIDGKPAVALEISKRTGENIIETIEKVKRVVEAERQFWPPQVDVTYSQDRSSDIRIMLTDLENNLISAIVLIMIVTVATLGLRSSILIGVAIPGSFLIGILVLAAFGLTINIVVLFSLILAVGILVDGATVMAEFADRKMAEGLPPREAYGLGAKRMAWPIIASTATTAAAFLPLLFWPGVVGEFMKFMPMTVSATLAASLLMALVFVPVLGATFGRREGVTDPERMKALARGDHHDLAQVGGFIGFYVGILNGALRHPGKVVLAATLILVGLWTAYALYGRGVEFFPEVEPDVAVLHVHGRGNLSIDERDALMREVEQQVLAMDDERNEFDAIYTVTLGSASTQGDDKAEDVIGTVQLEFGEWDQRRKADEILAEIRDRTAPLAGIFVEPRKQEGGPPVGKPIQMQLASRFPELLDPAIERLRAFVQGMPGVIDVEDTRAVPGIEWEITVDRAEAAKYGVDVTTVGSSVQLVTRGLKFGEFRPDDAKDEIDIVARYPTAARSINELDQIRVPAGDGFAPISNFVVRDARPKVGIINRVDGERVLLVKADVLPGVLADNKVREIRAWLDQAELDPQITVSFKGEDEEQQESQAFLVKAFLAALFLIAIILLTQFNSFYSTVLILSAIVMSTVGVMIGLLALDQPFGIVMNGIGVIALAGIVVSNNIILIDTFDQIRDSERTPREAILRTCAQRVRPVLLTAVTTVLGLVPMMFGVNIDFVLREVTIGAPSTQWWIQLSTAIVFGLTFATVLTLIVTPSALMVRENVRDWIDYLRQRRRIARIRPIEAPIGRKAAE